MTKKKEPKEKAQAVFALDPVAVQQAQQFEAEEIAAEQGLEKSESSATSRDDNYLGILLKSLRIHEKVQQRMAFDIDPSANATAFGSVYRHKIGLTPDHILKKITGPQGDDLVNQILQARANIMASFGRPRTSRFDIGFEFQEINTDQAKDEKQIEEEKKRLEKSKEILWNCGYRGLDEDWHPNLSQFMKMITRDGLTYGRFAVEFIKGTEPNSGEEICHSFRAVDAGTIYRIVPNAKKDKARRAQAIELLQQIKDQKFDKERYMEDEYKWVQVIQGNPVQLFTEDELVVYNLYPTTNVEYNGYPLTPIDQALNAIATHINISLHNKLYFEHGRASRGMLVFQSDDIDESTIQKIRLQFHSSINSVQNSWRMPVFAVGADDNVQWQSIDTGGRDKEFQFLSDDTARVIMGAFQISPEELPGYAHLSRGTNTQALSESDNEYQLTAARDVGLRPLMYDFQDFFNSHVLPRFDKMLSKTHSFTLAGLEHDSPEREAQRLGQDAALHMTYNEVLEKVEKETLPASMGGDLPMSQQWQMGVAPYLTVGQILEQFFKVDGASKDPRYNYIRDPFWLQYQQMVIQKAQMAMQAQMQQQQAMMGGGGGMPPEEGGAPQEGGEEQAQEGEEQPQEEQQTMEDQPPAGGEETLEQTEKWLSANHTRLNKTIADNHNTISKQILKRHTEIAERNLEEWRKESEQALGDIMDVIEDKKPKKDK